MRWNFFTQKWLKYHVRYILLVIDTFSLPNFPTLMQVTAAVSQPAGKGEGDALSQATAVIKSEVAPAPLKNSAVLAKSFICEICNKGFAKREHLTKHTRIHKDTKR